MIQRQWIMVGTRWEREREREKVICKQQQSKDDIRQSTILTTSSASL